MPNAPNQQTQLLLLVNVLIILLLAAFSATVVVVLVRRSVRQRLEAERLAAMGTATARILHQLKNPMQHLLLNTELLRDERVVEEGGARREVTESIVAAGGRVTDLMGELTTYAAGGQRQLHLGSLQLQDLVGNVIQAERLEAERVGVTLEAGSLDDVVVHADLYFLRQAIENIVRNAREALIEAGTTEPHVVVTLQRRGAEAVLTVRDNGPGIEPARLATVFEPFVSTKSKGMGLGLAICRDIIRGHGGRIDIRSQLGAGTTVLIRLPQAPPEMPA